MIEEVGLKLLAEEAKLRAASIILAPTCNIQRTPLGGRSFESFSEDPHLSGAPRPELNYVRRLTLVCHIYFPGTMAAAYVNGLQSEGVSASASHRFCICFLLVPGADLTTVFLVPFLRSLY